MATTGEIIYKGFAPTIKIIICIGIGYLLTKRCNFLPVNAKGVSIISLNVSLPALVFGSMIQAFTSENIKSFGPLFMCAVIYQLLGLLFALITREFFYVPADFQYGILVLGILFNWGNLPTAIVQTLAKSEPFDPATDEELGVAYIAVFVLVTTISTWPLGLHKVCAWDFREENLKKPPPPPLRERWSNRWKSLQDLFKRNKVKSDESDEERGEIEKTRTRTQTQTSAASRLRRPQPTSVQSSGDTLQSSDQLNEKKRFSVAGSDKDHTDEQGDTVPADLIYRAKSHNIGADISRKKSRASSFHSMMETTRPIPPTAPLEASGIAEPCYDPSSSSQPNQLAPVCSHRGREEYNYHHPMTPAPSLTDKKKPLSKRLWPLVEPFLSPFMAAIVMGILCSTIKPVKALFVNTVDGYSGTVIPFAPDGNPPLSFIADTATFLGGISIPCGLMLLGASFGRLKMPKKWSDIPFGAIIAMTVFKMVILPIFGVFFIQALRDHSNLFPKEDKMRLFVSILLSGTPSSVNQLVITQLYNPNGTADTLSMFLALQYILMPILST
ncbi:membrane protein [Kwoniella heveanensis BCC8398]|uniref:Membrane protein n=1 Tax=Kwoniella heveanensis BCC8398 TaxID=1296120 RepID=A0A1B9GS39_9TREE|nr:membrane protein [Kwoniella heveanensis BCC8398]